MAVFSGRYCKNWHTYLFTCLENFEMAFFEEKKRRKIESTYVWMVTIRFNS